MSRPFPLIVAGLIFAVALGLAVFRSRTPVADREVSRPTAEQARAAASVPPSGGERSTGRAAGLRVEPKSQVELAARPMPQSLQDTTIPGGLAADENGHLIVGRGVLQVFDYFLSATGEEPTEVIHARIFAEIEKRLPPTAQREAKELFQKYLDYRGRARELYVAESDPDDLDGRLEEIRRIRREAFGEELAQTLFGDEEAVDYVAVAQREIARDPSLSEEEKLQKIDALEQQLPEPIREARAEAMKPVRFFADQERLRQEGASPAEIRALRESYFGAEAADRLEELDREEAAWGQRLAEFRAERARVEADPSLSPEQRVQVIEELSANRFTAEERVRAEALDRIEAERQTAGP